MTWIGHERRIARRFAMRFDAKIDIDQAKLPGTIVDVSKSGLGFATWTPVRVGAQGWLEHPLLGERVAVMVARAVPRPDGQVLLGLVLGSGDLVGGVIRSR